MVTDEQYDSLVNTIQREYALLVERDLKREEEISKLATRVAKLEQFAPMRTQEQTGDKNKVK